MMAAARWQWQPQRRWRQCNSAAAVAASAAVAAVRQRNVGGGGSTPSQRRQKLGGSTAAATASVAVAAALSAAAVHSVTATAWQQWQCQRRWQQRVSATLGAAWRRHGGGSGKRGGGAQRDVGSAVAAARRLRWIRCHCLRMCRRTRLQTLPMRRHTRLCPWLRMEGGQRRHYCCRWQRQRRPWRRPPRSPMRRCHRQQCC